MSKTYPQLFSQRACWLDARPSKVTRARRHKRMTETVRRSAADSVIVIGRTALPVIAPDSSVAGGFEAMLAASVRTLRNATHHNDPTRRPETVHRFRVGLRRLRSLLSAFRTILPNDERRALGARLGALGKQYSRAREWDVFLSSTLRPMAEALADEPAVLELEACAREARRRTLPEEVDFAAIVNDVRSEE